jgi:hypothetical protein
VRVGVIMVKNLKGFRFDPPHRAPLPQEEREFPDENQFIKTLCSPWLNFFSFGSMKIDNFSGFSVVRFLTILHSEMGKKK